jgi:hypothetical protein
VIRLYLAVLSSFLIVCCVTVVAQAQGIPLLPESSADYTFGQDLRFSMVAHNAANVERITLRFRPELSPNSYEVDVPFESGETVSVTYTIDSSTLDLAPFRDVSYSWELHTDEKTQTVPEQRFTYVDDRFEWNSSPDGQIVAHWTGNEPELGQRILDTVDAALDRLLGIVSVAEVGPLEIYVYPSSADLRAAFTLADVEDARVAQLATDVVMVTSVNPQTAESDLAQSIPYELAQLVLFRAAGDDFESIPWWLREGIAVRAQLSGNPRHEQLLESAARTGQTFPLRELCKKPSATGDMTLLASAQSASLLDFLVTEQSPAIANRLLSAYLNGANCEAGIEDVLGQSVDDLEVSWLSSLGLHSPARQFLNTYGIWILLLLAGTGLAAILVLTTRSRVWP